MGWAREGGKGDGEPFQVKTLYGLESWCRGGSGLPGEKTSTGEQTLYRVTNPPGRSSRKKSHSAQSLFLSSHEWSRIPLQI